ncbi:hypothetical protein EMGR_006778 [Emarellia grisea]
MRRKANDIIALFDLRNRAKLINQEPIRHSLYPQLPFSSSHKYHTSKEENRKMENPAYDESHLTLYITMSQIFSIWVVPFHVSPVRLTTVINLTTDSGVQKPSMVNGNHTLYYITKQEDLYQVSEWIKFLVPHVGHLFVLAFQSFATLFCLLGVVILYPIMWLEERRVIPYKILRKGNLVYNIERKIPEIKKE